MRGRASLPTIRLWFAPRWRSSAVNGTASTEEDAKWLFDAMKSSPIRRIVIISRGTHLMHLEESRYALYRETEAFLVGKDATAAPNRQAA